MADRRGRGILAIVGASLLWGTTGAAATLVQADVSPLTIGAATMGVGGVLLVATAPRSTLRVLRDAAARRWVALGAAGVLVYPLAFYSGMDLAGVAVGNAVALGSGPLWAGIVERLIDRRPLGTAWRVAASASVIGVALLALGSGTGAGRAPLLGVALGLLAGAAYALYTWSSSHAIALGEPSRGVMGAMFGLGALPLLLVLAATGGPLLGSWSSLGVVAYLALGPMAVAYVLFGIGLRSVRGSTATLVTLLEPVVATLLAVTIVGERLGPAGWLGMALVLAALVLIVSARRPSRRRKRL